MKKLLEFIAVIFFVISFAACTAPDSTDDGGGDGGGDGDGGDTTALTLNASVAGSVSSSTVSSSASIAAPGSILANLLFATADTCASASFEVFMVGGDGTAMSTGTATNGEFDADVNEDNEVVIKFDCGSSQLKCFGKAGSTDLICDPISNAVVLSLESSLGAEVESSSVYEGLSVAKIAEGMVETLKLMSALDPTNNIIENLETAADAASLKEIIEASAVGTLFDSLATLATEKEAENEAIAAGSTAEEAIETAAASSWTVEKLVNLLTGMGMVVTLDLSDGMANGPGLYNSLMDEIDTWLDTDFMSSLRTYVMSLYTQLYVNKETLNVSLECIARNEANWEEKPIRYRPYVDGSMLTCIDDGLGTTETADWGISDGSGNVNMGYWVTAVIKPSYDEPSRNDPTGERAKQRGGYEEFRINFIDVFSEFEEAMNTGACSGETPGTPGFSTCVQENDLAQYFAGLLGIYQFMRKADLRGTKFSLNELYAALTDLDYMRMRLQGDFWQAGVDDMWVDINITDCTSGDCSIWSQAWNLAPQVGDPHPQDSDGRYKYDLECAAELCSGSTPSMATVNLTTAEYQAMLERYLPSFASTMGMFQNIPTMEEIKQFIFKSSHHEPYNIAGSRTFHVKGAKGSTTEWEAEAPILCQIVNPDPAGNFESGTSSIQCVEADGVTWDSDGRPSDLSGANIYGSYYGLQERGGSGDGTDRYYGLINLNNGTDYRLNGQEFRVRGIKESAVGGSGATVDGATLDEVDQEFCDTWQDSSGSMETQCWNEKFFYVAVQLADTLFPTAFFNPYAWDIPIETTWEYWDGTENVIETFEWNMQIAVSDNGTSADWSDDWAVCLAGDAVTEATTDIANIQAVTIDETADVIDCFNASDTDFYYLTPNWGISSRGSFTYHLVKADGTWTWSDASPDASDVAIADVESQLTGTPLGPAGAEAWLNHFEVANLGHNAKFDPYCDDLNGDGECNCTDTDGDSQCTLVDDITEPTISEPPFWSGDMQAADIEALIDACGGLDDQSTPTIRDCLIDQRDTHTRDITMLWADWNKLFHCRDTSKTMRWVDTWWLTDDVTPGDVNAGGGCGATINDNGPVRMRKLIKRDNAYDVARPNKMLKLISGATASSGTGVTIDPTEEIFNFQEAVALMFLRFSMPLEISVYDSGTAVDVPLFMNQARMPGEWGDPSGGLLRAFMEAAGAIAASP